MTDWVGAKQLGINGYSLGYQLPQSRDLPMNGAVMGPTPHFLSTPAGGLNPQPVMPQSYMPPGTTPTQAVGQPYADLGKSNVGIQPTTAPTRDTSITPGLAPRTGLFESMLGGLTSQFSGVLPGFIRDPLVGAAQGVGQVLDVPTELLGHVPLPWVKDTKSAFETLPETDEMAKIRQIAVSDPDTGLRYMANYVRNHEQEYMAALGMPRMLSPFLMPDANILERIISLPGIPQQLIARTYAGFGQRNLDQTVLNADPATLPQPLQDIQQRFRAGTLTRDQVLDELTATGYAFTNDAFTNFFLSVVTDPVIVGSLGTGLAAHAVETGALATRTLRILDSFAATPEGEAAVTAARGSVLAGDARSVANAAPALGTEGVQRLVGQRAKDFALDVNSRTVDALRSHPDFQSHLENATSSLSRRDRALVAIEPGLQAAAKISHMINEPFAVFGKDRIAGAMQALRSDRHVREIANAYGPGNVRRVFAAAGQEEGVYAALLESYAQWASHSEMSLIHQNSLVKTLQSHGMPVGIEGASPTERIMETGVISPDLLSRESRKQLQRVKPQYVFDVPTPASFASKEAEAAFKAQRTAARVSWREGQEALAARRMVYASGMTLERAMNLMKGADDNMLGFAEGAAFGKAIGRTLDARAKDIEGLQHQIEVATAKGDTEAVAKLGAQQEMIARYTLVGPRELTVTDAQRLLKLARSNASDAAARLRDAINQYDILHQNFEPTLAKSRKLMDDDVLKNTMAIWLEDAIGGEGLESSLVSVLKDSTLPANMRSVVDESVATNGPDAAYRIGLAPAKEAQWRVSHDLEGNLIGAHPWVEYVSAKPPTFVPTRLDVVRNQLFGPIRGDQLLNESRRRFIYKATEGGSYGMSSSEAGRLFDAVRRSASERGVQPRGLMSGEFEQVVDGMHIDDLTRQKLGNDGLALLTAQAFEGDLMSVGLTSKVSGKLKTRAAGWDNWVGVVAERIYPLIRFGANPLFQIQEWVEPYFFNIMRGIKPAMQWTQLDRQTLAMLDRWKLGTMFEDQAEYTYVASQGWANTVQTDRFGRGGTIAIANEKRMKFREVKQRKLLQYIREVRADGGENFKRAVLASSPETWAEMTAHYGTTDAGELAVRYWIDKGIFHPDDPHYATFMAGATRPQTLGKPVRINPTMLARHFERGTAENLRTDIETGALTEQAFRDDATLSTWDPAYIDRAWAVASSVEPPAWFSAYRASLRRAGRTTAEAQLGADVMEQLATAAATRKGMGLHEFLAEEFTSPAIFLDSARELPARAYTQTARSLIDDLKVARPELNIEPVRPGTAKFTRIGDRVAALMPTPTKARRNQLRLAKEKDRVQSVPAQRLELGNGQYLLAGRHDAATVLDHVEETMGRGEAITSAGDWSSEIVDLYGAIAQSLSDEEVAALDRHMGGAISGRPMLPPQPGFTDVVDPYDWGVISNGLGARTRDEMVQELGDYEQGGLYHVTTAQHPVMEQGLRSRAQTGGMGLGGGAGDVARSKVSVTYDRAHAQLIEDRIKLAVRAARGEATTDEIIDHFIDAYSEFAGDAGVEDVAKASYSGLDIFDYIDGMTGDVDVTRLERDLKDRARQRYADPARRYTLVQDLDKNIVSYEGEAGDSAPAGVMLTGSAAEMARVDPSKIRTVRVAARKQATVEWVPNERELRFKPEDLQLLGDENAHDMRARGVGTLADTREELTARLIMAFSGTQQRTTPLIGMQQVADMTDELLRGQRAGKGAATHMGVERLQRVLRDWQSVQDKGMGFKLYDFFDQMFGRKVRTLDPTDGLQPGAMDVWLHRGLGFMSPEWLKNAATRMVESDGAPTVAAAEQKIRTQLGLGEGKLTFDMNADYEGALRQVNDIVTYANQTGWQGKHDWTAGQMQAVLWSYGQQVSGVAADDVGTLARMNSRSVAFEVAPSQVGHPMEWLPPTGAETHASRQPVWNDMSLEQRATVTYDVSRQMIPIIEQLTGAKIIDRPIYAHGAWRTGEGLALSPNTTWTIHGTEAQIDDAMDSLGYLLQQDEIFATQGVSFRGKAATVADPKNGRHWAYDVKPLNPDDTHPAVMGALGEYLADAFPDMYGYMTARDLEGAQLLRSVWMPEKGAQSQLRHFEQRFAPRADWPVEQELANGTWTRRITSKQFAGLQDVDVPMVSNRTVVKVRRAINRREGYPDGSTFEHQRGLARQAVETGGATAEEAYGRELGGPYLDAIRARGRPELADRLARGYRDEVKGYVDGAHESVAADARGSRGGQRRLAGLGAGTNTVVQQRGPRGVRGAISYSGGTRNTLYILRDADASTGVHELFHVFSRVLDPSAKQALMEAYKDARGLARTPRTWGVSHEEWAAKQFEHYVAGGAKQAPTPALRAVFNSFADWAKGAMGLVPAVDPRVSKVFDSFFQSADPAEARATFDVDSYRWVKTIEDAFANGEDQAHTNNYYKRGRSWTERSINHPYLGMYPASYMWGKVLPQMVRFLLHKPFGIDAPLAGLQLAKHTMFYTQLMIQTNPDLQQFVTDHPQSIRMLSLLLPGTPWDIPVNAPAWARHLAEDEMQNRARVEGGLKPQQTDYGRVVSDTVNYAFGLGKGLQQPLDIMNEWNGKPAKEPDPAATIWSQMGYGYGAPRPQPPEATQQGAALPPAVQEQSTMAGHPAGMVAPGNIDIHNRPVAHNADGSISTVLSIGIEYAGKHYLIPTVIGGKVVSNREAINHFKQTKENLGQFVSDDAADAYGQSLHEEQATEYAP